MICSVERITDWFTWILVGLGCWAWPGLVWAYGCLPACMDWFWTAFEWLGLGLVLSELSLALLVWFCWSYLVGLSLIYKPGESARSEPILYIVWSSWSQLHSLSVHCLFAHAVDIGSGTNYCDGERHMHLWHMAADEQYQPRQLQSNRKILWFEISDPEDLSYWEIWWRTSLGISHSDQIWRRVRVLRVCGL